MAGSREARDQQLRVAVLGCGTWGINHVRVWEEMGHLALVCDPDPSRQETARSLASDVSVSASHEEALERPDIDAVVIATPATTHAELARHALDAGKDVLVEKPLAMSVSDGRALVSSARAQKRVLMVGHVLEYHPAVARLRRLIDEGELGKIRYVYSNRLNFGRVRTEENALWSFAPHDIALLLRLSGGMPEEVAASGGAYLSDGIADTTLMRLRFARGVSAHVFVSWLHPFKEHRFVVVGSRQMAVLDDTLSWSKKLALYPHRVDWMGGLAPVARTGDASYVELEAQEPLRAECEDFVRACVQRVSPLTDGESGIRVLRVIEAGQRSMDLGGSPIRLAQEDECRYFVHPSSVIDSGAQIGDGTKVWHYSHIMSGSRIGRDCILGQNVFIGEGVRVGDRTKIQNNVSVYQGVELEDGVFCGPSVVFTNVSTPRSEVSRRDRLVATVVKRGATLGANATIVCGVSVGRYAFVGAGATVTRDVPPHALVVGVPATQVGWVCVCGLRLDASQAEILCPGCHRRYLLADGAIQEAVGEAEAAVIP